MNWVPEVGKEQEPTTDDMAYDILAMTYKKWAQLGEEQRPAEGTYIHTFNKSKGP